VVSNQYSGSQRRRFIPFLSSVLTSCFVPSSILIQVAKVEYDRQPEFEVSRPGGPTRDQRLAWTMLSRPAFREVCEKEGVGVDWALLRWMRKTRGRGMIIFRC
jgi:hypothetical protein